ncbi:MAG: enoyl-CoA hydratase [Gammaproteobacteria bacterium]|nr:enoyl-CoA hydratase [Gammaproteobacteria bacterium]
MAYEFITVQSSDHITTVTIDRPERMNALHPYATIEMNQVFDEFEADPQQWVAIVTGAGDKAFCAGNDLKFQAEHGGDEVRRLRLQAPRGFGGLHKRTRCIKPIIAAVNGFALGGGFELALSCDLIIAAEHASFGLPEPRVGLLAGAGGVHRLPRQIPYHIAMGVILAGKRLSAGDALRYGLANEVVPLAKLMDTARDWAHEILKGAPLSVQGSKEAAVLGLGLPLDLALEAVFPTQGRLSETADYVEGPKAFAEKRPPNWTGA